MDRSNKGSFTIPQIREMLNVSNVTAYKISKIPELNRKYFLGQYRILKKDFWKWYDRQTWYRIVEEEVDQNDYFSAKDIEEMFHLSPNVVWKFVARNGLQAGTFPKTAYVKKQVLFDWYLSQRKYVSDDPRLPKSWFEPTYEMKDIKRILGVSSREEIYHLYERNLFDIIHFKGQIRVDKQSFDQWLAVQTEYPVNKDGGDD